MHLAPHVSDQHVCTLHGQISAHITIDVTSAKRRFTGDRCGPWEWDHALRQHRATLRAPKLTGLPFNQQVLRTYGWAAGLQKRVPHNDRRRDDRRCVHYRHRSASVWRTIHLCTISFDLWAPHIVSKPSFTAAKKCGFGFGRTAEKFADSDVNSESVTTLLSSLHCFDNRLFTSELVTGYPVAVNILTNSNNYSFVFEMVTTVTTRWLAKGL